ncbi:hypothetical protein GCM10022389_22590 [Flavobacterium cheonanense]|uniref:Uncharacterized protein n=1 Tax=Flavobacterium cheonanense TaxID=706183 RepID=A0ABP7VX27_9FLAO
MIADIFFSELTSRNNKSKVCFTIIRKTNKKLNDKTALIKAPVVKYSFGLSNSKTTKLNNKRTTNVEN